MLKYIALCLFVLLSSTFLAACANEAPAVTSPSQAAPVETSGTPQAPPTAEAAAEIKEAGNTLCPITNSKVGSMEKGAHVDYKGYRVGLCCNGCKEKFMKAPEENLKKALEKK